MSKKSINSSLDSAKNDRNFGKKEKSSKTVSINSSTCRDAFNNFINLENIKKGLIEEQDTYTPIQKEFLETFDKFNLEEEKLLKLYEKEEGTYDKNELINLDDEVFEERARKIFKETYELKEYLFYPHFRVENSSKKKSKMIKLYYYTIEIEIDGDEENKQKGTQSSGGEPENNKKNSLFFFLDDRNTYMVLFQDNTMIFQKDNKDFTSVTVISPNFEFYNEFEFRKIGKVGNEFETSFIFAQINEDFSTIQGEIKTIKYQMEMESKNTEKKEKLEKTLEEMKEMSDLLKKKYSPKNLSFELSQKKNELKLLEMGLKFEERKEKETKLKEEILNEKNMGDRVEDEKEKKKIKEKKIENIKNEIKNYESLLKKITIKIKRCDQELDGLFFTTKQISLSNPFGETLKIPAGCPVVLEVKNNSKFLDIMRNITKKMTLLKLLKLNNNNNIYFVGVLRDFGGKKEVNKNLIKAKNTIIISANETTFLQISLYDLNEKKPEEKEESKGLEKMMKMIEDFKNDLKNLDVKISKVMDEMTILKEDIKRIEKGK
jgi:hypothetical protein